MLPARILWKDWDNPAVLVPMIRFNFRFDEFEAHVRRNPHTLGKVDRRADTWFLSSCFLFCVIIRPPEKQPAAVQTPVSRSVGSSRVGSGRDAAIAGRERSNGEIPPGGMRCFPLRRVARKEDTKGDPSYSLRRYSRHTGLVWPAISVPPPATKDIDRKERDGDARVCTFSFSLIFHCVCLT